MNTIYDNTFTIGQTSAINFEAGPGIMVTEPTAGTVRIGADETVLWSGSDIGTRTSAFTLSEPINNFERVRFEGYQYGLATPTYEITTNTGTTNISVCMTYFCKNADSNPFQIRAANYTSTNGLDYTVSGQKFMYWNLTGYTAAAGGNNTAGPNLTKIVGINRIGGNA